MNNEALKPLVESWLSEKFPSANEYEPTFQVDHITGDSTDFLSIDSELYSYSFDASLIIGLSQAFPNTEISINETQDGLSIFMHAIEPKPEDKPKCPNCGTQVQPEFKTAFCKLNDSDGSDIYEDDLNIKICPSCEYWELA